MNNVCRECRDDVHCGTQSCPADGCGPSVYWRDYPATCNVDCTTSYTCASSCSCTPVETCRESCGADCDADADCSPTPCKDICSTTENVLFDRVDRPNVCESDCTCSDRICLAGSQIDCGDETCNDVCENSNNRFKDFVVESCEIDCISQAGDDVCDTGCCVDPGWADCGSNTRTCTQDANCACVDGGTKPECEVAGDKSCDNGCTASGCNSACTPDACDRSLVTSTDADGDGYFTSATHSCDICDNVPEIHSATDLAYEPGGEVTFDDGIDNDCDGFIDCRDSDSNQEETCACIIGDEACRAIYCNDGVDNDGDGAADLLDVDCDGMETTGCSTPTDPNCCADGVDNDADGDIDCVDVDCQITNYDSQIQVWQLTNINTVCSADNQTAYGAGGLHLCQEACSGQAVNCRCIEGNCGATCDADEDCPDFGFTTGCYNAAGGDCEYITDTECTYIEYNDDVDNDCPYGTCACENYLAPNVPGDCSNPDIDNDGIDEIICEIADADGDGWTDSCDPFEIDPPMQSMKYLEISPVEKVLVDNQVTFESKIIQPSCDFWTIDEIWKSNAGIREGCAGVPISMQVQNFGILTGLNVIDFSYKWSHDDAACAITNGLFGHLDYVGCGNPRDYTNAGERAQDSDGISDFSDLTPQFNIEDVYMTGMTVTEMLGGVGVGRFELDATTSATLSGKTTYSTCMIATDFEQITVLKESPGTSAGDSYDTDCGTATDWRSSFGTPSQIQPWDHLMLFYAESATTYYLEIGQMNDFISDLYIDGQLVDRDDAEFCEISSSVGGSSGDNDCYCEHFTDGCSALTDDSDYRTSVINLGSLDPGYHSLKFKIIDVCEKGYASGITVKSTIDYAASPKYSCSDTGNLLCTIDIMGKNEFCSRPQRVGCVSYIDNVDADADTEFENVLHDVYTFDFDDCPLYCRCELAGQDMSDQYYLNTLTGMCESLCCETYPCPGCCWDGIPPMPICNKEMYQE